MVYIIKVTYYQISSRAVSKAKKMAKRVKYYRLSLREVKRQGKKDGRDWQWKPWRPLPSGWPFWESKEPDPPVNQKEPSQYEAKLISLAHKNLKKSGVNGQKKMKN